MQRKWPGSIHPKLPSTARLLERGLKLSRAGKNGTTTWDLQLLRKHSGVWMFIIMNSYIAPKTDSVLKTQGWSWYLHSSLSLHVTDTQHKGAETKGRSGGPYTWEAGGWHWLRLLPAGAETMRPSLCPAPLLTPLVSVSHHSWRKPTQDGCPKPQAHVFSAEWSCCKTIHFSPCTHPRGTTDCGDLPGVPLPHPVSGTSAMESFGSPAHACEWGRLPSRGYEGQPLLGPHRSGEECPRGRTKSKPEEGGRDSEAGRQGKQTGNTIHNWAEINVIWNHRPVSHS